ncbi:MAG: ABC transporter substrate-binding protein [Vulcanimicrobiaceae bacterium]
MNRPHGTFATLAAIATLVLITTGLTASAADAPGVSDREVVIGGLHPFSGPASAYSVISRGEEAYFAYVNERGGVNGRRIVYKDLDDAYSPPQALQLAKQLVEQDHVFALFNTLGTANNLAIRPYLNEMKVPHLFVASGATTWGRDAARFPWTIGFNADYQAEATVFAKAILARAPSARIAVLFQNDDFGQDYITGLKLGLGAKAAQIVKTASYEVSDTDVRSQISSLKASGADVLLLAATPKSATQALVAVGQLGWNVATYLSNVSASQIVMRAAAQQSGATATEGVVTANYTIDPSNTTFATSRGMKIYREALSKYIAGADPANNFYMYGMAAAYAMTDALQRTGKTLTRERLMDAVTHLDERDNPFLIPGIVLQTSPTDRFPIRQEQLWRYTSGNWQPFGALIDVRK